MLHAPDFLGYESAIEIARDHPGLVAQALELKKTGNRIMTVVGGREVHPVNVRVGGWYRTPRKAELQVLVEPLESAREIALGTVAFAASLPFPDYTRDYELVCLAQPGEYPIDRGRIVSTGGIDIDVSEYEDHFVEEHVEWSNALHSSIVGRGSYLCGPLARFAIGFDDLRPLAKSAALDAGLGPGERNPFKSIVVRAVELVEACDEALALIAAYEEPDAPAVECVPRAGVGWGVTEAPRGILYHRYEIDADGTILSAKIVPPTSQNQRAIEEDLRGVVETHVDIPDDELALLCEQTIRNYDPCISCATHFLKLDVERR
jgi:coenzyme F420-reducing hydrogenase alpha subunit